MVQSRLIEEQNSHPKISKLFLDSEKIVLHHGDTLEFLKTIPDNTFKLIISSPPYNIGKVYEQRTELMKYLQVQENIIKELVRVLKNDGSICWEVGNYVENGEVFPLDIYYYGLFKDNGLKLRNRIIWHFGHGLHAHRRLSGRYESILWFTKSNKYTFNLDDIRVPSKYPGKRNWKGINKGKPSGNPLGKNPSDFWEALKNDWEELLWDIPNVKAQHPEKTIHPCQFPIELVERCILALTNKEDWVFDPYAGVSSALLAALIHDRKAAGVEKEKEYIDIGISRINELYEGNLRKRPLGKPVYQPNGKEKVSQIPKEWIVEGLV
ncbi:site-specific DNA-methyltransferase [Candidatus Woesearchaeota archaeon]|nr:site-specific DNA-methyltransferase [Candidatus Woesearchaeota archaeon]